MKTLPRTMRRLLLAFGGALGLFLALTSGVSARWLRHEALAEAPAQEAVLVSASVSGVGRWSRSARLTWRLGGEEVTEVAFMGPFSDLDALKSLNPGDRLAVHTSGGDRASAALIAAWRPYEVPLVAGILLLALGAMLPLAVDARRAAARIRDWPVVLAEVSVVGGSPTRPDLRLRYEAGGRVHEVQTTMTVTDLAAWARQVQARAEGPLPLMIDPRDPTRWRPCRFEWPWVKG